MQKIIPVILSGGSGVRLWPLSRSTLPKQFLKLRGARTMFQETVERVIGESFSDPIVVCNEEQRFVVAEQLRELGVANSTIVLEPESKNTAPAIATAALLVERDLGASVVMALPADHYIDDDVGFTKAVAAATIAAFHGSIVALGVNAKSAATGYGYIQLGKAVEGAEDTYRISSFVEKPNREVAAKLFADGAHLWNSGIYVFPTDVLLAELRRLQSSVVSACENAVHAAKVDMDFLRLDAGSFRASPSESIDTGLMEHTDQAVAVRANIAWRDIGSWLSLWEAGPQDEQSNVTRGDVVAVGSKRNYLHAESRLVAVLDVSDTVVVETSDAVLVAPLARSEEIRQIADKLKSDGRSELGAHARVYRPWGHYECIAAGARFHVKRITVKPGRRISLQMHNHRAEHWIVLSGEAAVTCGTKTLLLCENESIFISVGEMHRLENPGQGDLQIIEVQTGSYLGEDDITRFSDDYGRPRNGNTVG